MASDPDDNEMVMPELPEVETMRRGIQSIVGLRIRNVHRVPNRCRPILIQPGEASFRRRVTGQRVIAVDRLGKRVVLRLNNDYTIVFEPRMTGLVLLADPPDQEHLRFRIELRGNPTQVLFWDRRGLGNVRLFSCREFEQQLVKCKIGPDALTVSLTEFKEQLGKTHRAIKVALLDQHLVAGIGNLYASEILHLASINPTRRSARIRNAEWQRIYEAMRHVLNEAIHHEGSTLSDGTYRNALNIPGGYQKYHRVYGREGESCKTCASSIVKRFVQAQRSTFFCPSCQGRVKGLR